MYRVVMVFGSHTRGDAARLEAVRLAAVPLEPHRCRRSGTLVVQATSFFSADLALNGQAARPSTAIS